MLCNGGFHQDHREEQDRKGKRYQQRDQHGPSSPGRRFQSADARALRRQRNEFADRAPIFGERAAPRWSHLWINANMRIVLAGGPEWLAIACISWTASPVTSSIAANSSRMTTPRPWRSPRT